MQPKVLILSHPIVETPNSTGTCSRSGELHHTGTVADGEGHVSEEHEGVEDICDKLARCPLPPAAPPPPPPPTPPPPPPASPTSTGGVSQSSSLRGNSTAHYVNVPFSRPPAKTNRDPNEPGSAPVPGSHRADGSSISYAHPITAMATAQRSLSWKNRNSALLRHIPSCLAIIPANSLRASDPNKMFRVITQQQIMLIRAYVAQTGHD
ncbi:hypothetical protein fugu_008275 [Takifugu bimaculatus]|uniref:Uncharacterized protein n=1 Tax=Takifugu bimaculatus TaxID=433685 RepID=A0A4Z2B0X8_9TELE|nr:hypothetical protein fugu_008275 [Takifugu bimaculatus]